MSRARVWPSHPPLGAQSPAYAAAAGVPHCHAFIMDSLDPLHQTRGISMKSNTLCSPLQAVVLL